MSRKMVVTGPPRLQIVDEEGRFVEKEKWVAITALSASLEGIIVGNSLMVAQNDVTIGSLILNFLKPYNEVVPQALRWVNDPDEEEFSIRDYNEGIAERHGRKIENLAVSEAFAMDVMKTVAHNCRGFSILDRGTPQAKLLMLQLTTDGTTTPWLVSFDKLQKP